MAMKSLKEMQETALDATKPGTVNPVEMLRLDEVGLLLREDIKNMQGKEQRAEIYKYLKNALLREVPNQDEYKF